MAHGEVLEATSADGTELAVHDLGGTGETALAVHGTGLCGLVFRPLAAALAERLHVFALDLRGHGRSAPPVGLDFAWARLSEDVAAAAARIGAPPFGIVHSVGGNAALRAEAIAPGTFTAMFCFEPVMRPPEMNHVTAAERRFADQALRRRSSFASRSAARERYVTRKPFDTVTPDALDAYLEGAFAAAPDGAIELACRPAYEAALYLAGVDSDLWTLAPSIRTPVTVAYGSRRDNELGPFFARAAARQIPDARLVAIERLGHFGPLEDPVRVAEEVITSFEIARA